MTLNTASFGIDGSGRPMLHLNLTLDDESGEFDPAQLTLADLHADVRRFASEDSDGVVEVAATTMDELDQSYAQGLPLRVGLDLDTSGSLDTQDPDSMRTDAAAHFVPAVLGHETLDATVSLFSFPRKEGHGEHVWVDAWASGSTPTPLLDDIEALRGEASGTTPMWASVLEVADEVATDDEAINAIVLFTDGQADEVASAEEVIEDASGEPEYRLYIVGLGEGLDHQELNDVALATGGHFSALDEPDALTEAFDGLAAAAGGSVELRVALDLDLVTSSARGDGTYRIDGEVRHDRSGLVLSLHEASVYIPPLDD
jgi:hypothetical protein